MKKMVNIFKCIFTKEKCCYRSPIDNKSGRGLTSRYLNQYVDCDFWGHCRHGSHWTWLCRRWAVRPTTTCLINHKMKPNCCCWLSLHDDVIKRKHFPRYWPFVWEFTGHRWIPLTKASDAELWCFPTYAWTNGWVNNRYAGDLGRNRAHYDVTVMIVYNPYPNHR